MPSPVATTVPQAVSGPLSAARQLLADYVELTKPKVQSLLLLTTVTTMEVAGSPPVSRIALTCLGGYLSAGGAAALNHVFDRDIDAQMKLAACLALVGFIGYVGLYTMYLKRRTPQNIVLGGAAGAVPPLVGWAATRGTVAWTAVYLFAIVFYWTPPHFWALSLLMKDDYARVGVPMMPVVRGEHETRRQILLYTLLLYAISQLPFCAGAFGGIYLAASMMLGLLFLGGAVRLYRRADRRSALRLYLYSLCYLALLFGAMVADVKL
jgi:protoheme IX farnesyltransferase